MINYNFINNKLLQTVVNTMKETEWERGGENFLAEATDSAKALGQRIQGRFRSCWNGSKVRGATLGMEQHDGIGLEGCEGH